MHLNQSMHMLNQIYIFYTHAHAHTHMHTTCTATTLRAPESEPLACPSVWCPALSRPMRTMTRSPGMSPCCTTTWPGARLVVTMDPISSWQGGVGAVEWLGAVVGCSGCMYGRMNRALQGHWVLACKTNDHKGLLQCRIGWLWVCYEEKDVHGMLQRNQGCSYVFSAL